MDDKISKFLNYSEAGLKQIHDNLSQEYIKSAIESAEYTKDRIIDIIELLHKELKNTRYDKKIIEQFDKVEHILKNIYKILNFLRKCDNTKFNPQACEGFNELSKLSEELDNNLKKILDLFEQLTDEKEIKYKIYNAIWGVYEENPLAVKRYFFSYLWNDIFQADRGTGGEISNLKFWQYRHCDEHRSFSTPDWVHGTYPREDRYMKKCLENIKVIRRCKQVLIEHYAILNN